ncbi:CheR family methyltransferase [Rhizobium calliandrae]|uniref:Blue-light-activated histidine kinase n=1 Tax=Rhizobium calliandrae TaxID=1312182 RepID=A0ABT7KC89_9HYPH|nr:CheR family methyltransferase [Rhizobium calliandrae]MDL2406242.1 CheR family methyltransferase [Rhizobium calliandrae]
MTKRPGATRSGKASTDAVVMNGSASPVRAPIVIGIAASAAETDGLEHFFEQIKSSSGAAFVVILQQRDAIEEKAFHARLTAASERTVELVSNDGTIEAERIYIVPGGLNATLKNRHLMVRDASDMVGEHGVPDSFLVSLAEQDQKRAIGLVMSGCGTDGTLGVVAIREQGGLALAEKGPEAVDITASSSQPSSAAALADLVLPAEELATRVKAQLRTIQRQTLVEDFDDQMAQAEPLLTRIAAVLRNRTGHDFHGYKPNTFLRRVQRRIQVTQTDTIENYLEYLRSDAEEAGNLFNDLLIGVTQFFRDMKEFEFLEREIVPKLFEGKGASDQIRIWVLGCSTGEEAYSIAILLREHMARVDVVPHVQIFATDIDNRALAQARVGRYAASAVKDVSSERLARWFIKEGEIYSVVKELREMCLFSKHNLIKDAPFSRLDMVSCRNLLIYLGADLQNRVIPLFHFALRPGGYLFLGNSENVSRHGRLFSPVDRRFRIFRQVETMNRKLPDFPLSALPERGTVPSDTAGIKKVPNNVSVLTKQADRIMERYSPAYMIVDENFDVLHFSGRTGRFIDPLSGHASLNVFSLIHRDLRIDLRAALLKAETDETSVKIGGLKVGQNGDATLVTMSIEPIDPSPGQPRRFMIILQDGQFISDDDGSTIIPSAGQEEHVRRLEDELRQARDRLQATIEELESTNEELKASNEEYQSVNEELQSSNEELRTVNGELADRVEELARANSDLRNLLDSTQIAAVFLDNDLRIESFTPAITDIFHLIDTDLGRPIHHIAAKIAYDDLEHDARRVIRTLSSIERETNNPLTGSQYLIRVLPYRSIDNVIEGAVLTFLDVTALVRAEERLRDREALLRSIVEGIPQLVWRAAADGTWTWSSPQWRAYTGQSEIASLGKGWLEPIHPDDREKVLEAWRAAERDGNLEIEHRLFNAERNGYRTVQLRARPVMNGAGKVVEWFGTATDVHEMQLMQERQQILLHELQHRVRNTLAIVRLIAERSAETSDTVEEYARHLEGRINAMARTQALLTSMPDASMDLKELIESEISAQTGRATNPVVISGPSLALFGKAAESMSLVIHELTSNAVKYGALSGQTGQLHISLETDGSQKKPLFRMAWRESGLKRPITLPVRRGFGSELIEGMVPYQFGGKGNLDFKPDGLTCTIEIPLSGTGRLVEAEDERREMSRDLNSQSASGHESNL